MELIDSPVELMRHRLTVEDYHRMSDAGVFAPGARVELIAGEVIDMAPIGSRHWAAVNLAARAATLAVGMRAIVSAQSSIRLGEDSEPEPDLAIVRARDDFYRGALPTAADTLLVIEVADTTLRFDRGVKLPLYARHGIPEVWIIDLENGFVRFFRQPEGDRYADITATETPGATPVQALPGIEIDLSGVLG